MLTFSFYTLVTLLIYKCNAFRVPTATDIYCDVVIGGGNTGALSAAITAAQSAQAQNKNISICLLEPTDWYGGQMATEGVSEMDYGPQNSKPQNQPKSFRSLVNAIGDKGNCHASVTCYQPQDLMNNWILPTLSNLSQYITVFDRTVITNTYNKTDFNGNKYISSVSAIQRIPINSSSEWEYLLSQQIQDWYTPSNSSLFIKKLFTFHGKIFIEGTEFGDIISTSGIDIIQGVETPNENSTNTNDLCGQSTVFPFFLKILSKIPDNPPIVPLGNDEGLPYTKPNWQGNWIERRAYDAIPNSKENQININDISQQTWANGNDYRNGYLFLSVKDTLNQSNYGWKGGLNITSLYKAEQRSFGWYHFYWNLSNESESNLFNPKQLIIYFNCTGTKTGLSKLPYLRDTRRSFGLFGFRLNHSTAMDLYNETNIYSNYSVGYKFNDTVAIGDYNFFDMHLLNNNQCKNNMNNGYPKYISNGGNSGDKLVPYYIPFRSIANNQINNLLFSGKNIAQTFFANSASRLHPVEYNIGVAVGATAQYMISNNLNDTKLVYQQIYDLQKYLKSDPIQQPLDWS